MVPQNGQQHTGQGQNLGPSGFAGDDSFNLLDAPHVAKQMAALTAANQARIAQNVRMASSSHPSNGTSSGSYLGTINSHSFPPNGHDLLSSSANGHANFVSPANYGHSQTPNNANNNASFDPSMAQPNSARNQPPANMQLKQRQYGFLQGLHNLMAKRGNPLPPQLTGIPSPTYDPILSPWNIIEPSKEVGAFVLAGKDVDLFKLWGIVFSQGGAQVVDSSKGWGAIAQQFDLPEEFPNGVQANGSSSVATMLSQYYKVILYPFEEMYRKNIEQQKKAQQTQRSTTMPGPQFPNQSNMGRPGMPNMQQPGMRPMNSNGVMPQAIPSANGLNPYPSMHNQSRPNTSQNQLPDSHTPIVPTELDSLTHTVDSNLLDQDTQGIKRKYDQDSGDSKRARQKTEPPENGSMLMSMTEDASTSALRQESQPPSAMAVKSRPTQQTTRRKIEYVPLKREVESYGGRDLRAIDRDWHATVPRRPLCDIDDWGVVDIECLCMSIRSRLSLEMSYALTTLTVLSTMRGTTHGSGFPIFNCPDLFEDILDLMEDCAFGEAEAEPSPDFLRSSPRIYTNRKLVGLVQDIHAHPFAPLQTYQGSKDPNLGPQQRPANLVMAVINIIRNLTTINDNVEFLALHPRLLDLLFRLCGAEEIDGKPPAPTSKNLSIADLLYVRKETVNIMVGISSMVNLSHYPSSLTTLRMTRRAFELLASYLIDPSDSAPPLATVQCAGLAPSIGRRPPALADLALDAFTRLSLGDVNRQIIAKSVSSSAILQLLESLVHRLPLTDVDFMFLRNEIWLNYIQKIVQSIYSLIFLAPLELKQKIRDDRRLGLKHVLFRLAQRVLGLQPPPSSSEVDRSAVFQSARRAVETMKLLDNAEESVDTSEATVPVLAFGMGFSDGGDAGKEKGTGMLGGIRSVGWEVLLNRDVFGDEVLFSELDSLVRVEC